MLPMFMAVSDQTIVASALPNMAATLGDVERISWVVVSYLVAATIAAPLYGYLGDVFGRRRLMFVALFLFMGSSILCSLAPTVLLLAGARMLQGFGGGGLMSLSQALIGEVVPPRQRGHYQGYLATVATVSSALGPVVGGFLTEHLGWKSIFLINLPLGVVALVLMLRLRSRPMTKLEHWSFDAPGLFYFVAFIVPVLVAMEQIRHFTPSSITSVVGLFSISLISLILLIRRERRAVSPLLPLSLFAQPTIWRANLLAACHGMSPSQTGLMLMPVSIGIGIGSITTGRLVSRTGLTMVFPSYGLIGATLGLGLFATLSEQLTIMQVAVILSVSSIFLGTVMTVVQVTIQTAAGRKSLGAAAGSVQLSRTVGAAFGTALLGAVLFASLSLSDAEAAGMFARLVDIGSSAMAGLTPERQHLLASQIAGAFRLGFFLVPLFTSVGLLLAWTNPTRRV